MTVIAELLAGIVDYAGLFPPAALDMAAAVRNYAEYHGGPDRWMLGRFVVPAARLEELASELKAQGIASTRGDAWRISALIGGDVTGDVDRVQAFNQSQQSRAIVDTLEAKAASPADVDRVAAVSDDFDVYVEVALDPDPAELIAAIDRAHLKAKTRTGGVTVDAFPDARNVVRFMRACVKRRVPFKATAGLHHPLRAEYRLTYAPDAPRGTMYGYLNVFLAAALLSELTDAEAVALLEERDPAAIAVTRDFIRWREHELRPDQAGVARELVASSFGSCSFREPVDELRALSLIP